MFWSCGVLSRYGRVSQGVVPFRFSAAMFVRVQLSGDR